MIDNETVSIVTTTHRSARKIRACIDSVAQNTAGISFKHYILANDPDSDTKDILSSYKNITVDISDTNAGSFSSNNNILSSKAHGKYLLFLNDDCYPQNTCWLSEMVNLLDKNPKMGVCGALLLYPGGHKIQHCGVIFNETNGGLPYHMLYNKSRQDSVAYLSKNRIYQAVTGACMLIRHNHFDNMGGFNEKYYYQFEDIDLCITTKSKLGLNSCYSAKSVLIHDEGISSVNNKMWENNSSLFKTRCGALIHYDYRFYCENQNYRIIA